MPPPTIAQPTVRAATVVDILAIRAFRSFYPPGLRYERRARTVLRKPALLLEQNRLRDDQAALLFEVNQQVVAVAALDRDAPTIGHVAAIGIERDLHGAYILGTDTKLSHLVLATCLEWLADEGCLTATAQVGVDHARAKALLERLNFGFESMLDLEYELHAVKL